MGEKEQTLSAYDLFSLGLSLYVLAALVVGALLPANAPSRHVLQVADDVVCAFFLVDFARNLVRAERKLAYLKWGWLDLLASIPTLDALRFARVARIVRIVRILRGFRSARHLVTFVLRRRAQAALWGMALVSFILVVFAAVAILEVERDARGANIQTAGDAVWWAYVTITTVGYGDHFPVTAEGRVIAAVLMGAGVGLFGTFTGYLATWFLQPGESAREGEIHEMERRLERLERLVIDQHSAPGTRDGG
ncbi:MAG TPA: ion transporter [Longimicrobium sp.]|nr:ion transporter [Longimicrobium sp.]